MLGCLYLGLGILLEPPRLAPDLPPACVVPQATGPRPQCCLHQRPCCLSYLPPVAPPPATPGLVTPVVVSPSVVTRLQSMLTEHSTPPRLSYPPTPTMHPPQVKLDGLGPNCIRMVTTQLTTGSGVLQAVKLAVRSEAPVLTRETTLAKLIVNDRLVRMLLHVPYMILTDAEDLISTTLGGIFMPERDPVTIKAGLADDEEDDRAANADFVAGDDDPRYATITQPKLPRYNGPVWTQSGGSSTASLHEGSVLFEANLEYLSHVRAPAHIYLRDLHSIDSCCATHSTTIATGSSTMSKPTAPSPHPFPVPIPAIHPTQQRPVHRQRLHPVPRPQPRYQGTLRYARSLAAPAALAGYTFLVWTVCKQPCVAALAALAVNVFLLWTVSEGPWRPLPDTNPC
jgi:hypothetical protein